MLATIWESYKKLEAPIFKVILANLFLNFINSAFVVLLPYYFDQQGYHDYQFARFVSSRFGAVMFLAIPLGFFIRGRPLIPLFLLGASGVPLASLGVIVSVHFCWDFGIYLFTILWGLGFLIFNISALPFILRNASLETRSEAIALNASVWGVTQCLCSFFIFLFQKIHPIWFQERNLLIGFSGLGFLGLYYILRLKTVEKVPVQENRRYRLSDYDWGRIFFVVLPNFIIGLGAGLTIPFMPLFFKNVFLLESEDFSLFNSLTAIGVFLTSVIVPALQKQYGPVVAIIWTQTAAVIALILLATTELYCTWPWALSIAIFCYMVRQPLMNMAGPAASEIGMLYAGERNQEMVGALQSSLWSGSWFVSSQIFGWLRKTGCPYYAIFLITSSLYMLGVFFYYLLIRKHRAQLAQSSSN